MLKVTGSPADASLIEALEADFSRRSGVRFINALHGPESTLAAIYTQTADIAFMPREIREPMERMAFQWALLARPFQLSIANAAIDREGDATQLGVFVRRDNPLQEISLDALDAIFGAEGLRASLTIRTWGQLGLRGVWEARPIVPATPHVDSIPALFFRRLVMRDSRKWNPELRQLGLDDIVGVLVDDLAAIAIAPSFLNSDELRLVAISPAKGAPAVPLRPDTVIDRSYPLVRDRSVIVFRRRDRNFRPELSRFLKYTLGEDGQAVIARTGAALPLDGRTATEQLVKIQ